ncbi:MAG: FAD binding domain-containing protein [Gemmatimonadota bacterium]|nr:FAD binding domain-containing protein [Gemmatimonadota bacterium]MDH4349784.1 FAD binding domain-containing protein [Gemmatimonadota bacterium]MDH5196166.1 FAD binding domain-containing protein [Gemmatimonadota bacterium]
MLRLPSFTYLAPKTLKQALQWKHDAGPEGMYVAGGTDLYPNMKRRHQDPKVVISLAGVKALRRKPAERRNGGTADAGLALAAGMTLTEITEHRKLRRRYPVVTRGAELISTPLLRNMGTLGGNLCLDTRCTYYNQSYEWRKAIDFCMKKDGAICWVAPSSPRCWAVQSSDLAPVMVALDAQLHLVGRAADRTISAAAFYHNDGIAYLTKQPDEVLTEIRLPAPNGWDATYHKLRRRGTFDFPVLGVAIWVRWDAARVDDARIVLGGVASWPQAVPEAAEAVRGTQLEDAAIEAAATAAFRPSKPMDNTDFALAWRKEMTRVYVRRALEELRDRHATRRP